MNVGLLVFFLFFKKAKFLSLIVRGVIKKLRILKNSRPFLCFPNSDRIRCRHTACLRLCVSAIESEEATANRT